MTYEQPMFTTDQVNLYNRNIFKTSLYIYIFHDEKCRLMRNLSLSMIETNEKWRLEKQQTKAKIYEFTLILVKLHFFCPDQI